MVVSASRVKKKKIRKKKMRGQSHSTFFFFFFFFFFGGVFFGGGFFFFSTFFFFFFFFCFVELFFGVRFFFFFFFFLFLIEGFSREAAESAFDALEQRELLGRFEHRDRVLLARAAVLVGCGGLAVRIGRRKISEKIPGTRATGIKHPANSQIHNAGRFK
jgi:hypothetical protein